MRMAERCESVTGSVRGEARARMSHVSRLTFVGAIFRKLLSAFLYILLLFLDLR